MFVKIWEEATDLGKSRFALTIWWRDGEHRLATRRSNNAFELKLVPVGVILNKCKHLSLCTSTKNIWSSCQFCFVGEKWVNLIDAEGCLHHLHVQPSLSWTEAKWVFNADSGRKFYTEHTRELKPTNLSLLRLDCILLWYDCILIFLQLNLQKETQICKRYFRLINHQTRSIPKTFCGRMVDDISQS